MHSALCACSLRITGCSAFSRQSCRLTPRELPLHYGVDWRVCNVYLTLLTLHFHFLQALPQYNRQLLLTASSDSSAPRPCALTPSDIRLLSGKPSKQGTLQNLLRLPMNAVHGIDNVDFTCTKCCCLDAENSLIWSVFEWAYCSCSFSVCLALFWRQRSTMCQKPQFHQAQMRCYDLSRLSFFVLL